MAVVGAGAQRRRVAALLLLFTLWLADLASAQANQLVPRDDAWQDAKLVLVRHDIIRAAIRRDTAALRPNLSSDFISSFGGDGGIDEYLQTLRSPDEWNELIDVLSFGGTFVRDGRDSFVAPAWNFTALECDDSFAPPDTTQGDGLDRFSCESPELLVVLGTNVRLRDRPGGTAVDALSLALVARDRTRAETRTPDREMWSPVILPTGARGWIATRLLRSPLGKRANFSKGPDGRWRMSSFVAGD